MNLIATKFLLDVGLWVLASLLAYAFRKPSLIDLGIPLNVFGYMLLNGSVMALLAWHYRLPRQTWQRVGVPDLLMLAPRSGRLDPPHVCCWLRLPVLAATSPAVCRCLPVCWAFS